MQLQVILEGSRRRGGRSQRGRVVAVGRGFGGKAKETLPCVDEQDSASLEVKVGFAWNGRDTGVRVGIGEHGYSLDDFR